MLASLLVDMEAQQQWIEHLSLYDESKLDSKGRFVTTNLISMRSTDEYNRTLGWYVESTSETDFPKEDVDDKFPKEHGGIVAHMSVSSF